jgi:hypothetical protein
VGHIEVGEAHRAREEVPIKDDPKVRSTTDSLRVERSRRVRRLQES